MKPIGILCGLTLVLGGCQQPVPLVYVDLDKVPTAAPRMLKSVELPESAPEGKSKKSISIEARPERVVSVDRQHSAKAIRDLLEAESTEARKVISERLRQYYQTEIDEFFDQEYAGLAPAAQEGWRIYREKIRPIFEQYAKARGPLVVALTVLTEFPNPDQLVKVDPESDPAIQVRAEKIRDLQRQIALLDQRYEAEVAKLDAATREAIGFSEERMNERVEAKRREINQRAEREASQQVSVRTDVLNERLVGVGAKRLPARAGLSQSVELGSADSGFKGVPSTSRTVVPPADVHRQLQTWLALNGYNLADSPVGVRDVTQDFVKWRSSLSSQR